MKTRKSTTGIVYAGCTTATTSRTQGSVSLSSAEAEYHGRVLALADAKQVQRIFGEYHEDHSRNGIVSSQANAERPCVGKMKIPAVCFHEPRGMVATSRYEEQCCRRFDKVSESTNAAVHVDQTKKIELAEPQHENVCSNMITARSIGRELMEAQQNSTPRAEGVNPRTGHTNFVTDH